MHKKVGEMRSKIPRVLLYSNNNIINKIYARCIWFEFENIIKKIDNIDVLAPCRNVGVKAFDLRYRIGSSMGKILPISINPGVSVVSVENNYEVFFTICTFPQDLQYITLLKNWRKKCKTAICWIDEVLVATLKNYKYFNKIISQFDYVFVSCNQAVTIIQSLIRGKCVFMAPGVDALLFSPYPNPPERNIDILSYGRRMEKTHCELIDLVKKKGIFYHYDTVSYHGSKYGLTVMDQMQHRLLLANLAKRSKYLIVNKGKFDEMAASENEDIIGARYFEGAASGAIMIGGNCENIEFKKNFFWEDAVVILNESTTKIEEIIEKLEKSPKRVMQARKRNIMNALLMHDWVYRWELVLKVAAIDPMPELLERKRKLRELSVIVEKEIDQKLIAAEKIAE
jgi:hypothetical protein